MDAQKQDELEKLKKRVAELEKEASDDDPPKTGFQKLLAWLDVSSLEKTIKLIGAPVAIVAALALFWDEIWLASQGRDKASVAKVEENIAELVSLDEKYYVREAEGKSASAAASESALIARRERLIDETFEHWTDNPTYFRPAELQILTHHLILQNRTDDALKVYGDYEAQLEGPAQRVMGLWLEARIYARQGPVQNLDVARDKIRDAFALSADIPTAGERVPMQGQLVYLRAIIELDRAEDCEAAAPFVATLEELAPEDRTGQTQLAAQDMRTQYDTACPG